MYLLGWEVHIWTNKCYPNSNLPSLKLLKMVRNALKFLLRILLWPMCYFEMHCFTPKYTGIFQLAITDFKFNSIVVWEKTLYGSQSFTFVKVLFYGSKCDWSWWMLQFVSLRRMCILSRWSSLQMSIIIQLIDDVEFNYVFTILPLELNISDTEGVEDSNWNSGFISLSLSFYY